MPLVDLTTNLKSLKYGRDTTNGGSSGEPFVTKDINGLTIEDLGRTGGSDLLIRGGFLLGDRIADDVIRLGKYFQTPEGLLWSATQNVLSTSGVRIYGGYDLTTRLFRANKLNDGTYLPLSTIAQAALTPFGQHGNKQGIDPSGGGLGRPEYIELQKALTTANSVLSGEQERNRLLRLTKRHRTSPVFSSKKREFTNIYSYLGGPGGGSLVGGPGRTSIRFADQRTGNWSSKKRYFEISKYQAYNLTSLSDYNQLLKEGVSEFYGLNNDIDNKISTVDGLPYGGWGSFYNTSFHTDSRQFYYQPKNVTNQLNFDNTISASGSVFSTESGRETSLYVRYAATRDESYDDSFDEIHPSITQKTATKEQQAAGNNATLTSEEIIEVADVNRDGGNGIIDFRRFVEKKNNSSTRKNGSLTNSLDWGGDPYQSIEWRVRLGDPGNKTIDRSDYTKGGRQRGNFPTKTSLGTDRINALYLYKSDKPAGTTTINDLVKFRIATIDPDNPKEVTYAHFRAFINGISDSFGAEWDTFRYMGRGENFYNYQGFNRSMRLNWTVAAQSKEELSIMYQKLNYLASTLAPNYSAAGFMRGNIHRLTIGGYVYEYPGIIESLDFTIPDDSPWEIGIPVEGGSFDSSVKELPHRIEVAMSFKPIDKFIPQTIGSGLDSKSNPEGINGGGKIKQRFLSLQDAFDNNVNDLYNDGIPEWAKV